MKIVINCDYGGFSVSEAVYKELGIPWDGYGYLSENTFERTDPKLIDAIEAVGIEESAGSCANLRIIEIPNDVDWEIEDYDGCETVHEKHRKWS